MVSLKEAASRNLGIFTISEAALYARISPQTLKYWLQSGKNGTHLIQADGEIESGKFVSFLEFIQALAIRAIRQEKKLPLQKIREAVKTAQDRYGVEYPLAKKHTCYLCGKDVLIKLDDMEDPVQITGGNKGQLIIRKILEVYLDDISWDGEGLANCYRPHRHGIIQDPTRRFGEPVVESCGVSAFVLWQAVKTEESYKAAAEIYGVQEEEIKQACHYYDWLEARTAA